MQSSPNREVNAIRSEADAAKYLGISLSNLRRKRRGGAGPRYVQLSARRIGYRTGDLDDHLERNARGGV